MKIVDVAARDVRPFDFLAEGRIVVAVEYNSARPGQVRISEASFSPTTEDVELADGSTHSLRRIAYHDASHRDLPVDEIVRVARYGD